MRPFRLVLAALPFCGALAGMALGLADPAGQLLRQPAPQKPDAGIELRLDRSEPRLDAMLERPLFAPTRRPVEDPTPEPPPPTPGPAGAERWILRGVFLMAGKPSALLAKGADDPGRWVALGAEIAGGRLIVIDARQVVIARKGGALTLPLQPLD